MGKIEVYFKNLDYADDKTYYHEFIVWTPDKAPASFVRAGPKSGSKLGSGSGGGSGSAGSAVGRGALTSFLARYMSKLIFMRRVREIGQSRGLIQAKSL